jgi:hypothetical protein
MQNSIPLSLRIKGIMLNGPNAGVVPAKDENLLCELMQKFFQLKNKCYCWASCWAKAGSCS